MKKTFNLIVAKCENNGIGYQGSLPWKLKKELKYFSNITKKVSDPEKRNAVIMGRKTYFSIPENRRPLPGRLNIVLSRTTTKEEYPSEVILCKSLNDAMDKLQQNDDIKNEIENIWIIGGSSVYKEALYSQHCGHLYITDVKMKFDCDTFFPNIPNDFELIVKNHTVDDDVPEGIQEENGIQYEYKIYKKSG